MVWQYDPYALPLLFAGSASVGLALFVVRRRRLFVRISDANAFVLLLLMIAEWSLANGGQYMSSDLPSTLLWNKVAYLGVVSVPVACAVFCLQYTGRGGWLRNRTLLLLCFVPVVTLLLDWTNEAHHLVYGEFSLAPWGSLSMLKVTYGPWFWVFLVYAYGLGLFAIALLLQQLLRSQTVPRRQLAILIASMSVPFAASVFDVLPLYTLLPVDYTPLAFTFTAFGFFWAVFRFHLFEIMPVAREAIVRGMGDGVIVLDASNRVVDINPAGEQMIGCSTAEALGRSAAELFRSRGFIGQLSANMSSEMYTTLTNGVRRYFDVYFSPLHDRRGSLVGQIGVLRDITDRKRMEEQLLKSERMAAIGELAAMVAHDLRNPLTGITGAAYHLRKKLGASVDEKLEEMLELIEKDVEYADKIMTDLLEYSAEIRLEFTETDVKSIVKDALTRLGIPAKIRVVDSTKDEPKMSLDKEKMRRVFLNLLQNSIDAMPSGGTLTITSMRSNDSIVIRFTDTGAGMTEETMRKLWTPLYTTKARGMGFGLSISKRLVEAHGGSINAESKVGQGSTFTVTLPVRQTKH